MNRLNVLTRHLSRNNGELVSDASSLSSTYDYIIVGGGTSGCVLAARLSEDPKVSVLLIEAGGNNDSFMVSSPMLTCPKLQNREEYDWQYRTVEAPKGTGRRSHWPRGRCLGGCSSINYMIYCRGDPANYNQWAKLCEEESWKYENLLPLFKKSERLHNPEKLDCFDECYHGTQGELPITSAQDSVEYDYNPRDIMSKFIEACDEHGIRGNVDYNSNVQTGAALSQLNVKSGKRCDVASCFLRPNLGRANLTVLINSQVTKLVFQGTKCTGVLFKNGSQKDIVKESHPTSFVGAKRDVILCTGAVGTPHLLLLSGVGDQEHLKQSGVDVVKHLPGVGENLQDHTMVPVYYKVLEDLPLFSLSPLNILKELVNYFVFSTGLLMLPFVLAVAFFRTNIRPEEDGNDVQIHITPYVGNDQNESLVNLGYDVEKNPRYDVNRLPEKGLVFLPSLLLPFSRGRISLRTRNFSDHPCIDPRYFEDERDIQAMMHCYRKCKDIAEKSAAFSGRYKLSFVRTDLETEHDVDDDAYIRKHILEEAVTIYHPVGTAKMGLLSDPMTVVNPKTLQVVGLENLRVADCSIMPNIVSGNTHAPAIMIGEKAAVVLKQEYSIA